MRHWKWLSLLTCLVVFGFSFIVSTAYGQTKAVELKYSVFFPAPHKNAVLAGDWAKEIEKRTNGAVKITVFYGGTLTPADKCYDGVVKGISDIGFSVFAYTMGKFPLLAVADLPLGMKSGLVASKAVNEFIKKFNPKELDEVKVMYLHGHGPGILHTKKEVKTLEDLKGMKIRCTGMAAKIIKALEGTPVAMPMGETYDALSRGVVDGSVSPYEALQGWKWGEVVKFTVENYGSSYSTAMFVVMNKDKWNSLSPENQRIIEKVNEEFIEKQGKTWDEIDKAGRDFTVQRGNKIISLSQAEDWKWVKAVKPLYDDYVKDTKAKGLPGEEALKFYLETIYKLQK
jgi:TRAP-type C4-dicarboxylate transport system substrate-binding protein